MRLSQIMLLLFHIGRGKRLIVLLLTASRVVVVVIKAGAPCRSERLEKYNRLIEIELLSQRAKFAGLEKFGQS